MGRCAVSLPGSAVPAQAPCDAPYSGLLSGIRASAFVDNGKVVEDKHGTYYNDAPCARPNMYPSFTRMTDDKHYSSAVESLSLRSSGEEGYDVSLAADSSSSSAARIASAQNADNLRAAVAAAVASLYGVPTLPAPGTDGTTTRSPEFDMDNLLISFAPPDKANRMNLTAEDVRGKPLASVVRGLGGPATRSSTAFAVTRLWQYVFTGVTIELDDLSTPTPLLDMLTIPPPTSSTHPSSAAQVARDGSWDIPVDKATLDRLIPPSNKNNVWGYSPRETISNTAMCAVGLFGNQLKSSGCANTRSHVTSKLDEVTSPRCTATTFTCPNAGHTSSRQLEAPVPLFPGPGMNIAASVITNALGTDSDCFTGDFNVPSDRPTLVDGNRGLTRLYAMAGSNLDPHQPLRRNCSRPAARHPWQLPSTGTGTGDLRHVFVYARLRRRAWEHHAGAPRVGLARGPTTLVATPATAATAATRPFASETFALNPSGALDDGCVDEAQVLVTALERDNPGGRGSSAVKANVAPLVPALVEFAYRPMAASATSATSRVDTVSMYANAAGTNAVLATYFSTPLTMPADNPCDRAPGGVFAPAPLLGADPVCDCRFTESFPGAINYDLRDLYATVQQNEDVTVKPCMMSFCTPNGDDAVASARILPPVPGPCDVTNYVCENNMNVYGNKAGGLFFVTQHNVISNCGPGKSTKPTLRAFAARERERSTRSAPRVRLGIAEASLAAASALVVGAVVYAALLRRRRRGAARRVRAARR